jgi:hypothetical protein
MSLHSSGVYHDDDLTHFQIARLAWRFPRHLLDDWGRPGFTVLYAAAAPLGWTAARVFSGLLTAATAWLAYRIAVRQGIRLAALVPLLFWLEPLTLTLSYTTLTETPLAFYLTLATWLYLRDRTGWSAAVISLGAITRHEAVVFLGIWFAALLWRRRPVREWIWLVWAPVLHNVLSAVFFHEVPLLRFLDAHSTSEYGAGSWLTMVVRWPIAAGVGPLVLAWIGLPGLLRRPAGVLWAGAGLTYFLTHAILYRFGLFASGGYERFLVPIGPVVAVAATGALSQIWARRSAVEPCGTSRVPGHVLRRPIWGVLGALLLLWIAAEVEYARCWGDIVRHHGEWTRDLLRLGVALVAMLCGVALALSRGSLRRVAGGAVPVALLGLAVIQPLVAAQLPPPMRHCAPLVLTDRQQAYAEAIAWIRRSELADRRWVAASPWFDEWLGRARPPLAPLAGEEVPRMLPGDILLWDSREFASPRHGYPLAALRQRADFAELWRSGGGPDDETYCAIFEKQAVPHVAGD